MFIYISDEDVKNLINEKEAISAVENAFRDKALGKTQMPEKVYVYFKDGDFRSMPCYIESLNIAGIKVVNVHPNNKEKFNLPTVMAKILLINPDNGRVISIMEGTYITDLRTGAAGAVAVKYLARKNSKTIGLVGAGAQARTQLTCISEVMKIEEVKVWSRKRETAENFVKDFSNFNCVIVDNIKDACDVDVLVTTTPSTKPIVKDEWIIDGTHINAIGADAKGKQELDPKILKRAKIFVDDFNQAIHSGEVNVPISEGLLKKEEIFGELGEVIANKKVDRQFLILQA